MQLHDIDKYHGHAAHADEKCHDQADVQEQVSRSQLLLVDHVLPEKERESQMQRHHDQVSQLVAIEANEHDHAQDANVNVSVLFVRRVRH